MCGVGVGGLGMGWVELGEGGTGRDEIEGN